MTDRETGTGTGTFTESSITQLTLEAIAHAAHGQ